MMPARRQDRLRSWTFLGSAALLFCPAVAFAPGCGAVPAPVLGTGRVTAGDATILDDALSAARTAGYRPVDVTPESGRF